ncbi:ras association domain-containing protein 10-like [Scylla paramamosain]|uniref:ras association domain-containing protein 10-like n=1 Tax=Scylla paramamosain TaxID=85552 RepID=UPI00308354D7
MAPSQGAMSSSEVEIGVWVEGVQKWVTGVTRRTTCHDLIKALLRAQHGGGRADDEEVIQYVIVERWRKVERPLDHEQRILKVWRTWGEAVSEVRFSLRRVRDGEGVGGVGGSSGRPERSRRRQKMKHAHGSREALHPRKVAKEEAKFSDTMERLMRLVVAQGETIQTQLRRLQERENQIEQYEQQMHLLRVQNLGTDYLLHSYLKDDSCEAKDEPGSEEKSNDSGVVTEELPEPPACPRLEAEAPKEAAATRPATEDIDDAFAILTKIEEVNTRLLHEEEALSGMSGAVEAAREQHRDEEELLRQELSCVAHVHAQLVADARQNEQTLRETEVVLWQQRKQLEMLLIEDTESDLETKALREHLDYIIHLPPTAFLLPEEEDCLVVTTAEGVMPPTVSIAPAGPSVTRIPSLSVYDGDPRGSLRHAAAASGKTCTPGSDLPPPLPACQPPGTEEEDDDRDSANTSSLCVSSRSSTSSETSTGSAGGGVTAKPTKHPPSGKPSTAPSSSTLSHAAPPAKPGEAAGKDTDSTDSNSDTGLSSLHSSSDEAAYALDTLV